MKLDVAVEVGDLAHFPGTQCDHVSDDFFFSSRRRHTRCSRDWSSDVCSSDLTFFEPGEKYIWALAVDARGNLYAATGEKGVRSEERRVGKECRSRWSPYH